jgi:hypothetical protein
VKPAVLFLLAAAGMVLLASAESQRQVRLAAYGAQLRMWQVREEIAMRAYLAGSPETWIPSRAPEWQG